MVLTLIVRIADVTNTVDVTIHSDVITDTMHSDRVMYYYSSTSVH